MTDRAPRKSKRTALDDENKRKKAKSSNLTPKNDAVVIFENDTNNAIYKALQIAVVLDTIFNQLPHKDLKNCGLVQRSWSEPTNRRLKLWHAFRLHIYTGIQRWQWGGWVSEIVLEEKTFGHKSTKVQVTSLAELENKLNAVKNKVMSFVVADSHGFGGFTAQQHSLNTIITSHGQSITHATIAKTGLYPLHDLLNNNELTRLEYLFLRRWNTNRYNELLVLSVKRIRFYLSHGEKLDVKCFEQIQTAFPNLEKILDLPLNSVAALSGFPQLRAKVKSLVLAEVHGMSRICDLSRLASYCLQVPTVRLESFSISYSLNGTSWSDVRKSFSAILKASRETLESLQIEPLFMTPSSLKIPVMPKLKHLTLLSQPVQNSFAPKEVRGFSFYKDTKINELFPNLVRLTLKGRRLSGDELNRFLPLQVFRPQAEPQGSPVTVFPHLQYLKLYEESKDVMDHDNLDRIATFFPNIVALAISDNINWLRTLPTIWRLWGYKLQELSIEIDLCNLYGKGNSIYDVDLDVIFTGISRNNLTLLSNRSANDDDDDETVIKDYKQKAGLSDMKELKQLKLVFFGSPPDFNHEKPPIFSASTVRYGFDLLPQLLVFVGIQGTDLVRGKIKSMLQPILDFVILDDDYTD